MTDKTSLGDRMKGYERASKTVLPGRMPVIIRVDGKAFHTYTKGLKTEPGQPFHQGFCSLMDDTAKALCHNIQGAEFAYVQSDEISILVHYYKRFTSEAWFDNEIQKMVSVSAGMASSHFTANSHKLWGNTHPAIFDSRVFVLPEAEVNNYFIWRQQDATRNSIQMLARSLYSHRECTNKNGSQLQEMTFQKGFNWNNMDAGYKRGRFVSRHEEDGWTSFAAPFFSTSDVVRKEHMQVLDGADEA